ncbi:MAG TPA: ABC transporter permease [Candidatus Acidoferrales bacterium]|nr:ABC transporter permease [Candidatus Acidoferrales bacterium]
MATQAQTSTTAIGVQEVMRPPRSLWSDAWYAFTRDKLAMTGLVVLVILVFASLFGPYLWADKGTELDFTNTLAGPSFTHPMGTDDEGRDLLARVLNGGRISIAVGITAVILAVTLGMTVGSLAGYFNRADNPLMRITDLFLSLPALPLLLVLVYLFRESLKSTFGPEVGIFLLVVFVIAILNWMPVARLVRAQFLSLKQKEFVEAARCVGDKDGRIIFKHIIPNTLSPVLVAATIGVGGAIITESTLSFLGLGFPSDVPTWGRILFDGANFLDIAPHWVLFPGSCIFLIVLSIYFIGDGLRDALDPRRKI